MKKCISLIAALALALAVAGCANDSDSLVSTAAASSVKRNAESAPAAATTGIIYNGSSNDINNGYTVVSGAGAFNKKYEYDTVAGVTYYVNWCDGWNSNHGYFFKNLPEGLVDCGITVCDASDNQIWYTDDDNPFRFTGTGGKVYIKVKPHSDSNITGKCAFRVYVNRS